MIASGLLESGYNQTPVGPKFQTDFRNTKECFGSSQPAPGRLENSENIGQCLATIHGQFLAMPMLPP